MIPLTWQACGREIACGLLAFAAPDQGWADMVVVVGDLAIQAIEAFIHIDRAACLDRANRTNRLTMVAAAATFRMASKPIEYADAAQNREAAAKRANETAIKTFDK